MNNKRVLLGMSGGVDSSVSAVLLKNQGYEVVSVTLNMLDCEKSGGKIGSVNTVSNAEYDAKKVCDLLGIEHHCYNCQKEFKQYVIDNFIDCYSECKTPNPCIECNRHIKFGVMYEFSKKLGCNYIATGHYAKTEYSEKYGRWVLKKSNSINKDQSYVLWNISKDLLPYMVFPLAEYENKDEIRAIARENNLEIASKPDSEDICFIQNGNYKEFLEKNSNLKPIKGKIVKTTGEVLGEHAGMYNYTIGQRKGLGIAYKVPLFVVGFNKEKNEVIVGEEHEIYKNEMYVDNLNWLLFDELINKLDVSVKTRYSCKEEKATIEMYDDGIVKVSFENPVARITPGQSAVFYIDDIVVGGGKIM